MRPVIPIEYVAALGVFLLLAAGWCAWQASRRVSTGARRWLLGVRLAAVLGVVLLALNIGRTRSVSQAESPVWAVLVDRSTSMATVDVDGRSRWQAALRAVERLAAAAPPGVELRVYPFGRALSASVEADALAELEPAADGSAIGHAVVECLTRHRARGDLLALAVLSDGRRVPAEETAQAAVRARAQDVPVLTTTLGGPYAQPNLSVTPLRRHLVVFPGQRLRVPVRLTAEAVGPLQTTVALAGADGEARATADLELAEGQSADVTLRFEAPEQAGMYDYTVTVPEHPRERVVTDNRAALAVSVITDRIRVLLVEGRPYWDSKFVAQVLRKQENMALTEIYRITTERFQVISPDGEDTEASAAPALPAAASEWGAYDLVLLGTNLDGMVSPSQRLALQEAVDVLGTCLVFYRGNPCSSETERWPELQPVAWSPLQAPPVRLEPTRAGAAAGLFGALLPSPGDRLWEELPVFKGACPSSWVHEDTEVVLAGVVPGRESATDDIPLVAQRQVGRGVVLAAQLQDFWQWGFFAEATRTHEFYHTFWLQLVHWALVRSQFLPGREWSLNVSPAVVACGERIVVRVASRRGDGAADVPPIKVTCAGAAEGRVGVSPVSGRRGYWQGGVSWPTPGVRHLQLATDDAKAPVQAVVQVLPNPTETDDLNADPDYLARLAADSGGQAVDVDGLVDAVAAVRVDELDAPLQEWQTLWDRAWFFGGLLALLALEWTIRRRSGLL